MVPANIYGEGCVQTVAKEGIKLLFGMFWKDFGLFAQHVRIASLINLYLFVLLFFAQI